VLPPDDPNFKYEILGAITDSLGAKQRITIPYRIVCLKFPNPEQDGRATGGGCDRKSHIEISIAIFGLLRFATSD
jgi:hypothetical protein